MKKKLLQRFEGNEWLLVTGFLLAVIVLYLGTGFAMRATDDGAFCGSCHVMHEQVRTHAASVHAEQTCNQCHAPKPFVEKVAFKAYAGTKDIYKFYFTDIDDVIHATDKTRDVVQQNCIECHSMTNVNVLADMDAKQNCTDCHRHVPHFSKTPISGRSVAGE